MESMLSVECEFGNVGFGAETCRVGCKVPRSALSIDQADELLCGKRLTGVLVAGRVKPDQPALPGMENAHDQVRGTFDIKGLAVRPEEIGFGLTFSVESVDEHDLIAIRRKAGTLIVETSEDLPEDERSEPGEDDDAPTHDDHEDVGPMPIAPKTKPLPKLGKGAFPERLEKFCAGSSVEFRAAAEKAFIEGQTAWENCPSGDEIPANPYPADDRLSGAWGLGWSTAADDDEQAVKAESRGAKPAKKSAAKKASKRAARKGKKSDEQATNEGTIFDDASGKDTF